MRWPNRNLVLRHTLREQYAPGDQTLVVTKYFENCLVAYPKTVWLEIQTQLLELRNDSSTRAFLRQFCASASVCNLDRQGRILIPSKLRQYAEIESEVPEWLVEFEGEAHLVDLIFYLSRCGLSVDGDFFDFLLLIIFTN